MNTVAQDTFISVNGADIRYRVAGFGPPLLLVHGLGGSLENWAANIGPLSAYHRVYAMDLPGFGRSAKTQLRDIFDLVRFIGDFMDALDIGQASLIGNSLGGGLVLQFTVEHPERVEKLVLVDNAGMGQEVIADFKICSIPVLGELLIRPGRKNAAATWRKIVYDPAVITDELISVAYDLLALPDAKKALLSALRSGIGIRGQRLKLVRQLKDGLDAVTAPTLVVWGRQDRILPLAHASICREHIRGSRLEIFDECGHMPQLEQPDKFNSLVLDFLGETTE